MTVTTIKVPVALRDRIASNAKADSVTMTAFLTRLMDEEARRRRLADVGAAMRLNPPGDDYWEEFAQIDAVGGGVSVQ
ncbi:MAG: hypothetical protein FWG16_02400 [Micrococcales bacterium]|nr:hypothetical protein [Micrococcales bacterium]